MASVLTVTLAGLLLSGVTVTAAGASLQRDPSAQELSSSWRRVRAVDLTVVGPAASQHLEEVLHAITAFQNLLSTVFPSARTKSPVPTLVVVFDDPATFQRFAPRDRRGRKLPNVGGYFADDAAANYLVLPFSGRGDYHTIFHEYTHYFMRQNFPSILPLWLSEGLAEFYSTFQPSFQRGSLVGASPAGRVRDLRRGPYIPLRELVAPGSVDTLVRSNRGFAFYAEAWALVHYLAIGRSDAPNGALNNYIQVLARTDSHDEAFKAAYGIGVEQLDREFRPYTSQVAFNAMLLDRTQSRASDAHVERMLDADARQLQAAILHAVGGEEAEKELDHILARDAQHVAARITLARVRTKQDRLDEAVTILRSVVTEQPDAAGAYYFLGEALMQQGDYPAALTAFDAAVKRDATSPYHWLGLSGATLALDREAQMRAAFARAVQADANPELFRYQALVALELGRNDIAAQQLHAYLDAVGLADEPRQYAAFLTTIAERRVGRPERAAAILKNLEAVVVPRTWLANVLAFFQGQLTGDALLAKARDVEQRTEARTYVALALETEGRRDQALTFLQWVAAQGAKNSADYELAKAELRRIRRATTTSPATSDAR